MTKSLLFLTVCGLGITELGWGDTGISRSVLNSVSSESNSLDQTNNLYEIKDQKSVGGSPINQNLITMKKNTKLEYKLLVESVGRIALGTAAIAGTTFVGICFYDALIKARSIREQNTLIKIPWFKWNGWYSLFHHPFKEMGSLLIQPFKQAFSLFTQTLMLCKKMSSSWSDVREVIACGALDWFFVSAGGSILFNKGWSTVQKGYKFGVIQIYKGTYGVWGVEK